jgi:hypothetical protein
MLTRLTSLYPHTPRLLLFSLRYLSFLLSSHRVFAAAFLDSLFASLPLVLRVRNSVCPLVYACNSPSISLHCYFETLIVGARVWPNETEKKRNARELDAAMTGTTMRGAESNIRALAAASLFVALLDSFRIDGAVPLRFEALLVRFFFGRTIHDRTRQGRIVAAW